MGFLHFIVFVFIVYLCWGSNAWLALLIKNHWFISFIVYFVVCGFISAILELKRKQREKEMLQQRFNELMDKYGDAQIAQWIMEKTFWVGETKEQLLESLGYPGKTETKLLKTKKKEILRYDKINARSYGLSIILENDIVVGWDTK